MTIAVRAAEESDIPDLVTATTLLLAELRHVPAVPTPPGAQAACARLISGSAQGAIWVAHDGASLIGFVALSVQEAMRTGGPYALIQELWVAPTHRSAKVGERLISAAVDGCRARGLIKIEVGLPGSAAPEHAQVVRFYQRCGFSEVGPRFRRSLE